MCGLSKRANYPEFIELVNKYDVLCFVETKTDDCDQIDLPGFQMVYMKIEHPCLTDDREASHFL